MHLHATSGREERRGTMELNYFCRCGRLLEPGVPTASRAPECDSARKGER